MGILKCRKDGIRFLAPLRQESKSPCVIFSHHQTLRRFDRGDVQYLSYARAYHLHVYIYRHVRLFDIHIQARFAAFAAHFLPKWRPYQSAPLAEKLLV